MLASRKGKIKQTQHNHTNKQESMQTSYEIAGVAANNAARENEKAKSSNTRRQARKLQESFYPQ